MSALSSQLVPGGQFVKSITQMLFVTPIPIVLHSGVSMFWRWPGESIRFCRMYWAPPPVEPLHAAFSRNRRPGNRKNNSELANSKAGFMLAKTAIFVPRNRNQPPREWTLFPIGAVTRKDPGDAGGCAVG
jgi:hypothetical protein